MNSNNDNLHTTVLEILSNQELALNKSQSTFDASMMSLFYAQGNEITHAGAYQKTAGANDYNDQINKELFISIDQSQQLLGTANQGASLVKQSTTNAAIAAENMQVAANAIVKLASDIGSLYSIALAMADTEITQGAKRCNELMKETAYLAEETSQNAMEASALTAEIIASTLQANALGTVNSFNNLKVINKYFDEVKEQLKSNAASLEKSSQASSKEDTSYKLQAANLAASEKSLILARKALNLNLAVSTEDQTSIKVSFDKIKSPFDTALTTDDPVENYYILFVKDQKKSSFTLNTAEELIKKEGQYIKVPATEGNDQNSLSATILSTDIKDADGEELQLGNTYFAFVLATFSMAYKKSINKYEDYLSAPSAAFALSHVLKSPDSIRYNPKTKSLEFSLTESHSYQVEYRCMYLPNPYSGKNDQMAYPFNLKIAEQIGAGNYTLAIIKKESSTDGNSLIKGTVHLMESSTDIFGNRLAKNQNYLPVILSFSLELGSEEAKYSNSVSSLSTIKPFCFQGLG